MTPGPKGAGQILPPHWDITVFRFPQPKLGGRSQLSRGKRKTLKKRVTKQKASPPHKKARPPGRNRTKTKNSVLCSGRFLLSGPRPPPTPLCRPRKQDTPPENNKHFLKQHLLTGRDVRGHVFSNDTGRVCPGPCLIFAKIQTGVFFDVCDNSQASSDARRRHPFRAGPLPVLNN